MRDTGAGYKRASKRSRVNHKIDIPREALDILEQGDRTRAWKPEFIDIINYGLKNDNKHIVIIQALHAAGCEYSKSKCYEKISQIKDQKNAKD